MERVILHSDLNNFYASVECHERPELCNRAVVISGAPERRRGVVVAKNELAKKMGVKTGDTVWQALQKCPDACILRPNLAKYREISAAVRQLYYRYTDRVEPFGLDEAWLDVTGSTRLFGDGEAIANQIRAAMKREFGLTVSVGVSFNKVFAKLGSDMKKPDAVTCITRANYKEKVWPLPVGVLLYAGRATQRKLISCGIETVGALAKAEPAFLESILGKGGLMLGEYARGEDQSPVTRFGEREPVKSIGNSMTLPRDISEPDEVRRALYLVAESVCERLRAKGLLCKTVTVAIRDAELHWHERQRAVREATMLTHEVAELAYALYLETNLPHCPVHSLGVRVSNLCDDAGGGQLSFFEDPQVKERRRKLDRTMDAIREKHGHFAISRAMLLEDERLYHFDPEEEQIVSFPGTEKK